MPLQNSRGPRQNSDRPRPPHDDRPRDDNRSQDRSNDRPRFSQNDARANDRPRLPQNDARANDRPRLPNDDRPRSSPNDRSNDRPRSSPNDRSRDPRANDRPRDSHDAHDTSREPRPEMKVCGVNACLAVAARRPDDVRRVYIHDSLMQDFGAFLKTCAANRVAYHVVEHDELERITQSTHHEGVCFIARTRPEPSLRQLLAVPGPRCLLYLDGVQNPHNLGAIVRVCAHFGAAGVLVGGLEVPVSTAMLRTAEGGGEWVDVLGVEPGPQPLAEARRAGYRLLATAARGGRDLYSAPMPERVVILLGSESHGVSPAVLRLADETLKIPGTGRLDSLNVACATSIILGDYWRTHPPAPTK